MAALAEGVSQWLMVSKGKMNVSRIGGEEKAICVQPFGNGADLSIDRLLLVKQIDVRITQTAANLIRVLFCQA